MSDVKRGPGRPREEGSGRSVRRSREQEQAEQQQHPRRKRIVRLLRHQVLAAERLYGAEAADKSFQAGVCHALRYLVPVDPAFAAVHALVDAPLEQDIKADVFPPDYTEIKIPADAYQVYCAVFDLLHGLESLSGPLTPQAVLDSYEIRRR